MRHVMIAVVLGATFAGLLASAGAGPQDGKIPTTPQERVTAALREEREQRFSGALVLDAHDESTAAAYERVLAAHRSTLVTVRFVQKTQGQFGDFEGENEINGVMVDASGLVQCSNSSLTGSFGRRAGRSVPTDIKILIGEDTEGRPARFIARDTELDLAWLEIKDAGDEKFPAVDLTAAAADSPRLRLGERVLALGVMGRFFGQEVLVSEGVVAGKARKPRELYVVRGWLDTDAGLPVFALDGRVAGFACIQTPDPEEITGNAANLIARGRGLILPVDTVVRAVRRAEEMRTADEAAGESAATQPAEDADEPGEPED